MFLFFHWFIGFIDCHLQRTEDYSILQARKIYIIFTIIIVLIKEALSLLFTLYNVTLCCVFFTLTDRASTIPNNTRGCQSGTWSAGQKKIRGTSTKLQ